MLGIPGIVQIGIATTTLYFLYTTTHFIPSQLHLNIISPLLRSNDNFFSPPIPQFLGTELGLE